MDSVAFADKSVPAIFALAASINGEAAYTKVPPCALAAIIANETGGKNELQEGADPATGLLPDGTQCGVGVCQITDGIDQPWNPKRPTYAGFDLLNPAQNMFVACEYFLAPAIKFAQGLQVADPEKFAQFGDGQVLFYAFAAYNEGEGAVKERFEGGQNPDNGTTDGYAARAMKAYIGFVAASHAAAA
jgi:hypothetical protein